MTSIKTLAVAAVMLAVLGTAACAADPSDLGPVTIKKAPSHPPVVLVRDGKAVASILVKGAVAGHALGELQEAIEATTGARLPVISGANANKPVKGAAIVIGDCPEAARLGLVGAKMPVEGFEIKTAPGRIYIVGNGGAATGYGVYEFLERFVGVRWYWPTEFKGRSVVKTATLQAPPVHLADAPVFRKRQIWPPMSKPSSGSGTQLGQLHNCLRQGNSWPIQLVVHAPQGAALNNLAKTYGQQILQMRSDGTRDPNLLSYAAPETLKMYLAEMSKVFDKGQRCSLGVIGKAVTVSPGDMEIADYHPAARKLWNKDGGQWGTASKIMAEFVNRLAVETKKRWPDVTIIFLPYLNYTAAPDGYKFPGNVEVQLCGMPGLAQYKEPSIRRSEQANIDKWVEITGRKIQNWHYNCWPADKTKAPYQYPNVVKRHYIDNRDKTVGTFINGVTDHWPRQNITLYVWMKCLWNPNQNVKAILDTFCERMFGRAAGTMRELLNTQITAWENSRWPGGRLSPRGLYQGKDGFNKRTVEKIKALLAKAHKEVAGDALSAARLKYYETPFAAFYEEFAAVTEGGAVELIAQKVGENPKIDGKLDEAVWQRAQAVEMAVSGKERKPPRYPTKLKALWTMDGVTFGFHMAEPAPDKLVRNIKGRDDSMAWWNDNVEVFLDVTGRQQGSYYHFIINPNAAIYDAKIDDTSWNAQGVKFAVHVGKDFWSLEAFYPFSAFPDAVNPAKTSGANWFGQFTRHRLADYKTNKEAPREYQRLNFRFGGPSRNLNDFANITFRE